jgi:hypothetical protein
MIYSTSASAFASTPLTPFARTLLDDNDAPAMRATLGLTLGTNVQPFDAELNALAGLVSAANQLPYFTGSGTAALTTISSFARTLLADNDATAMRATLGIVDSLATDPEISAIAALTSAADRVPYYTGSGTAALAVFTTVGRNIVGSADQATARANLGLGSMATQSSSSYVTTGANSTITSITGLTTALSLGQGGTGATTAAGARTALGLGTMATESTGTYLTNSTAAATYLTISSASATYATTGSLASYLTTASASATYATISSLNTTNTNVSAKANSASPSTSGTWSHSGSVSLTGTSARFNADFSNATFNSRFLFQSSTTNGNSNMGIIPNGTATGAAFVATNSSGTTNFAYGSLEASTADIRLVSGIAGTGTAIPLLFFVNGSERARMTTGGDFALGKTVSTLNTAGVYMYSNGLGTFSRADAPALQVNRRGSDGFAVEWAREGSTVGNVTVTTVACSFNSTSDHRLKLNQQPLEGSGAFIDALVPKKWTWKSTGEVGVGFIAHEFALVSPSSVVGQKDAVDENGVPVYQSMQASSPEVMANIIAELQALRQRVAYLESINNQ